MTPLLVVTHLAVAGVAWSASRWWTIRHLRIREIDGHAALELQHHDDGDDTMTPANRRSSPPLLAIILLVAALFVIAIGVQAKLAADDNAERDRKDRAYAECLTRFAVDLVDTLDQRGKAIAALDTAQKRKDDALDELLKLSLKARNTGAQTTSELPPALVAKYDRVLRERVRSQREYRRVYAHAQRIRATNPFVNPKVRCAR